jgi:tRNA(adenine34) deaminase
MPWGIAMNRPEAIATDRLMMRRCIDLSAQSGRQGEYPYAAVIVRNGVFVCESINKVATERDVTRHAEIVAIQDAQKILGLTSLDDCTLYSNAEPCAFCCYAIRESRIGRVVYGMRSPVMGGHSRYGILSDHGLSNAMPEVFAPPPETVGGYLSDEAEEAFKIWNPLIWQFIKARGLFVADPVADEFDPPLPRRRGLWERLMVVFRRDVVDRFGRRIAGARK